MAKPVQLDPGAAAADKPQKRSHTILFRADGAQEMAEILNHQRARPSTQTRLDDMQKTAVHAQFDMPFQVMHPGGQAVQRMLLRPLAAPGGQRGQAWGRRPPPPRGLGSNPRMLPGSESLVGPVA